MIKEFKQIEMHVGDFSTYKFKDGITYATKTGATVVTFSWSPDCRLEDEVFVARIKKVFPRLANLDYTNLDFETSDHCVSIYNRTDHTKPVFA